jgi:hypothetical protein
MAVVAICLLVSPALGKERLPRPSLLQLVARSEAIVTGKIVELQPESIVLELEHVHPAIVEAGEKIEVLRSRPVCHARSTEYTVDQRWIILVKKDERGRWRSAVGCDTESLIESDNIICGFDVPDPRVEYFVSPPQSRVKLADFQSAFAEFPKIIRATTHKNLPAELAQPGTRPTDPQVAVIGSEKDCQSFAKKSRVHKALLAQAKHAAKP